MMRHSIHQCQDIAFIIENSQARLTSLFVGHTDGSQIGWIRVTIAWIQQIESFFGKVKPAILVKILGIIFTDLCLKIALPIGNDFVKWFGCWCKIIRFIDALFMKIDMNLRQPFIVHF